MKIHENFHVKSIFHHDKSNNESLYIHIFSMFLRFAELCSARDQCICFQVRPHSQNSSVWVISWGF